MQTAKMATVYHFDARNNRFIADKQGPDIDSEHRLTVKAVKFLNSNHPLALFIQSLFNSKTIPQTDRDILLAWTHKFPEITSITYDEIETVRLEIVKNNIRKLVAEEVQIWQQMTLRELRPWGGYNLLDFYRKLQEDNPADYSQITILHPELKNDIVKTMKKAIDEEVVVFWHYLVMCFRIMRLAKIRNKKGL
jgi:hypothetical protein